MSVKGGSVVDTNALSYGEIFAIPFSVLTRWQQNLRWTTAHSAIRENNPILLLLSIFYEISRLLDPHVLKKIAFCETFYWYFGLKFLVSVFIYVTSMSKKLEKSITKKSFKIQLWNCFGISTTKCFEVERAQNSNFRDT